MDLNYESGWYNDIYIVDICMNEWMNNEWMIEGLMEVVFVCLWYLVVEDISYVIMMLIVVGD